MLVGYLGSLCWTYEHALERNSIVCRGLTVFDAKVSPVCMCAHTRMHLYICVHVF